MVFGRKNREIEQLKQEVAYLKGLLKNREDDETDSKNKLDRLLEKADNIKLAALAKKIAALEKIAFGKKHPPYDYEYEALDYPAQPNPTPPNTENFDIPSLIKSIPLPLRLALNQIVKSRYGVTIDDIVKDPTLAMPILADISNSLQKISEKKKEAEKEGRQFNPYDPTLFMK